MKEYTFRHRHPNKTLALNHTVRAQGRVKGRVVLPGTVHFVSRRRSDIRGEQLRHGSLGDGRMRISSRHETTEVTHKAAVDHSMALSSSIAVDAHARE